ncbi:MAG: hypothetical protein AAGF15_04980, partial [Pseudomonadota bacterium]
KKQAMVEETKASYETIRQERAANPKENRLSSLADARANRFQIDWANTEITPPKLPGTHVLAQSI